MKPENTGVQPLVQFTFDFGDHVRDRLRTGAIGYVQRHRVLLIILLITAAADTWTTIHFMTREGVEQELHPGFRLLCLYLGPYAGAPIAKALQIAAILLVSLYWRRGAYLCLIAPAIMYGWAAWYNVFGRDLYTPLLFWWLH